MTITPFSKKFYAEVCKKSPDSGVIMVSANEAIMGYLLKANVAASSGKFDECSKMIEQADIVSKAAHQLLSAMEMTAEGFEALSKKLSKGEDPTDAKAAREVGRLVGRKKFKQAWKKFESMDTFVREMFPTSAYHWLGMKAGGIRASDIAIWAGVRG